MQSIVNNIDNKEFTQNYFGKFRSCLLIEAKIDCEIGFRATLCTIILKLQGIWSPDLPSSPG